MSMKKNKRKHHHKKHHHSKKAPKSKKLLEFRPDPIKSPWAAEPAKQTWPMYTVYDNEMSAQTGYSR
jgi:hypothetical protein